MHRREFINSLLCGSLAATLSSRSRIAGAAAPSPVDARTLDDGSEFDTDLCIIGAGAAGITIARELKHAPIKILLLESGGLEYEPQTQALYEGESTGLPYYPLTSTRLRYFGGTTGHWNGWCAPLDPIDFQKRAWIPYSGWPIGYRDLDPWYRHAQEICQLGSFEYEAEYWEKQSGMRRLPLPPETVANKIIQFSPPTRFGQFYRNEILQASNVALWTFANVTDIHSNPNASHVESLEVSTLNRKKITVNARRYVVACGGMENPRLLLLSNKVNPRGLGNEQDAVGRYFMEHPHINTSRLQVTEDRSAAFYTYGASKKFLGLFGITPTVQRARKIANYSSILGPAGGAEQSTAPPSLQLNTRLEQVPNPYSRITLSEIKRDVFGQPVLRLHWQLTELDKSSIRTAEQLLAGEMTRAQCGHLQVPDWLLSQDNVWPDFLVGGNHHMGTTRMSSDPKSGVVDADCKVYGIDNLYIAGSSVFPTGGTANPTLTVVALAARLADHLRKKS